MMSARIFKYCGALALMLGGALAGSSGYCASVQAILPTPGLYQIDSDASHELAGGRIRNEQQVDGASGAIRSRTVAGGRTHDMSAAGTGSNRRCVQPQKNSASGLLAQLDVLENCPKQTQQFIGQNKLVHLAECPSGSVTVSITKIDNRTWEFETRHQASTIGGVPDLAGLRAPLEQQARRGATTAERAEAAALARQLPAAQKELDRQRSEQRAVLQAALDKAKSPEERAMFERGLAALSPQGAPAAPGDNTMVARERWTRVANQCTGHQEARR